MVKTILYYKFIPVDDPQMTVRWQSELCARLNLKGRVIISPHGINGTLGGDIEDLRAYKREMNRSGIFKGIAYKWSDATGHEFPRLSVEAQAELVAFGVPEELKVTSKGVVGGGKHLKPEQVHKLVKKRKEDVVFFDGRNAYEAAVGKFKNALVPNVKTTRDFISEIESDKYDGIKNKPIVTYCTGGIRCEILSSLMKKRGFKEVYQIEGGIVKYGEKYKDRGLWEGSLYIFDGRMSHRFSGESKDIGKCLHCKAPNSNYENCSRLECNRLVLICKRCLKKRETQYCSNKCVGKDVKKTAAVRA